MSPFFLPGHFEKDHLVFGCSAHFFLDNMPFFRY